MLLCQYQWGHAIIPHRFIHGLLDCGEAVSFGGWRMHLPFLFHDDLISLISGRQARQGKDLMETLRELKFS